MIASRMYATYTKPVVTSVVFGMRGSVLCGSAIVGVFRVAVSVGCRVKAADMVFINQLRPLYGRVVLLRMAVGQKSHTRDV